MRHFGTLQLFTMLPWRLFAFAGAYITSNQRLMESSFCRLIFGINPNSYQWHQIIPAIENNCSHCRYRRVVNFRYSIVILPLNKT
jgi:hypothetical protein